jgi:hypothetical protein
MFSFKSVENFGLWLQPERLTTLHGEQGIVAHVQPVAITKNKPSATAGSMHWEFGQLTPDALHLFRDAHFPLQAFFRWHLERIHPPKKTRLLLVSSARSQGISGALWQQAFAPLALAGFAHMQPADVLVAAHVRQRKESVLLLYCEDGLAELRVVKAGQCVESLQVGYGRYIAREIRRQFYQQHGIYLPLSTAEQAWRSLTANPAAQQVTLQGPQGSQLLLQEELAHIVERAMAPLYEEVRLLQDAYQLPRLWLMGAQHTLEGLFPVLEQTFRGKIDRVHQPEDALMSALQLYLQGQSHPEGV